MHVLRDFGFRAGDWESKLLVGIHGLEEFRV